jgi:hypothetical protein
MPPDQFESRIQSPISEAIVLCQLNFRLKPKLCFSLSVMHMYMRKRFLPREEEKPKSFLTEDCRVHDDIIPPSTDFFSPGPPPDLEARDRPNAQSKRRAAQRTGRWSELGSLLPLLWVDIWRIEELSVNPCEHSHFSSEEGIIEPAILKRFPFGSSRNLDKFSLEDETTFNIQVVLL